jgi:hypothetical protein
MCQLEKLDAVTSCAKNDRLDFEIGCEFQGHRDYIPDYIVKLGRRDGTALNVIIGAKGMDTKEDRAKRVAEQKWVDALNHRGEFGRWALVHCGTRIAQPKRWRRMAEDPPETAKSG